MKLVMQAKSFWVVAIVVGSFVVGGCATQKIYGSNLASLDSALKDVESGSSASLARAEGKLTQLLANTGNVVQDYPVQRFFAQYLLGRLHMQASAGRAFLTEPKAKARVSIKKSASTLPSVVSHLVATNYNAFYALDMYGSADGKPLKVGEQDLLPPTLANLGTERAAKHMQLCILTAYSQMLFESEANGILEELEVTDLDSLDRVIADGQASKYMMPWIYYSMWWRLKNEDPRAAFKFAARALETEDVLELGADEVHQPVIEKWLHGPEFMFICGACAKEVQADSMTCLFCDEETPLIDSEFLLRKNLKDRLEDVE